MPCLKWLSGNGFQQCSSLSFHVPRLLSSLAGAYLIDGLGGATQQLTTMGAPLPPTPPPGVTFCEDPRKICLPAANCRLLDSQLSWPVFWFSRYSLCMDPQRTPLLTVPLLFLWECGMGHTENAKSHDITVLFPSNGRFFSLHNSCFEQICRDMHTARQNPLSTFPWQWICNQNQRKCLKQCFLCSTCQGYIMRTTRTSQ
jgi:hypothetical protein